MKKILALFFVLLLTSNIASARTVMVRYGQSTYRFGNNAIYTPANRVRAGQRLRAIQYENAMINALNNRNKHQITINTSASTPEISRFNKENTIQPQRSYTRGGVTYYD